MARFAPARRMAPLVAGAAVLVASACSSSSGTPAPTSGSTTTAASPTAPFASGTPTGGGIGGGIGGSVSAPDTAATSTPDQAGWVDEDVTFTADGSTIHATYRHPAQGASLPAALLIPGSGPADRNGNEPGLPHADTLRSLAYALSGDGVATLRYDKLGTGATGLGAYGTKPPTLAVYEDEAGAALRYLAARPGVDPARLGVFGHSEGGLFALLLATHTVPDVPTVHYLGLLESLSLRDLEVIRIQLGQAITAQLQAGQVTAAQAQQERATLASTITRMRTNGTAPPTASLPPIMQAVFNPSAITLLSQLDKYDPDTLAATLPRGLPVLTTCSDADIQVTCAEVDHMVAGLRSAGTDLTYEHLTGVDHILKQDPSRTGANYDAALPFSPQLVQELSAFYRG